jgi:hypothetical protein
MNKLQISETVCFRWTEYSLCVFRTICARLKELRNSVLVNTLQECGERRGEVHQLKTEIGNKFVRCVAAKILPGALRELVKLK